MLILKQISGRKWILVAKAVELDLQYQRTVCWCDGIGVLYISVSFALKYSRLICLVLTSCNIIIVLILESLFWSGSFKTVLYLLKDRIIQYLLGSLLQKWMISSSMTIS